MTDPTPTASPLTDEEKDAFEALYASIAGAATDMDADNVALVRASLDRDALPEEVGVVVVTHEVDDEMQMFPLAIVATPEVFDAVIPPSEAIEIRDE